MDFRCDHSGVSAKDRGIRGVIRPSIALSVLAILVSCIAWTAQVEAAPGSWEYSSESTVTKVLPLTDGGAFISARFEEVDGQIVPGANTVYRIDGTGAVAWKFTPPEGSRVSLIDSTSDGRYVLVKTVLLNSDGGMRLLLLDRTGQIISQGDPVEDSNWVWLSPNGQSVLRWVESKKDVIMETPKSGKKAWSLDTTAAGASQPSDIVRDNISFVQPAWAAGCVLVGDSKAGTINAIGVEGKRLWKVKNVNWYPPAKSPVAITNSGAWMLVRSAQKSRPETSENKDIEYFSYNAGGLARSRYSDYLRLMSIGMSLDNPGHQEKADLVWEKSIDSTIITERETPVRTGLAGGIVLSLDLMDNPTGGGPYATVLMNSAVSVLTFDRDGSLVREAPRPVPDIDSVYEAWLAPSGLLVVKRPQTSTGPEAVQAIDQTGRIVWEKKPDEPITSVTFDSNRGYVVVVTGRSATSHPLR